MTALTWSSIDRGLALHGRIDENAELDRLADELPLDAKVIDLGGLVRINSVGVREWMDFASSIRSRSIALVRCSPPFVEQMNAIANFTAGMRIESVLAAFECEDDGDVILVEVSTDAARRSEMPAAPSCDRCGRATVPAVEDDLYYRFLRYTK